MPNIQGTYSYIATMNSVREKESREEVKRKLKGVEGREEEKRKVSMIWMGYEMIEGVDKRYMILLISGL